ncbi:hypothetical protein RIF29_29164 [Crotalaria pallida]|uniref:Uncharacterized protein n=1 Tax=Crotalaria pallida TaxID=3830 RepID=A0AAN9HX79_CROPI
MLILSDSCMLNFSSSAPYGKIPSCRIPFLLGEPHSKSHESQDDSLSIVPIGNDSREEETFRATVVIDLEPREPTPGIVDVHIETNLENGQIMQGQLQARRIASPLSPSSFTLVTIAHGHQRSHQRRLLIASSPSTSVPAIAKGAKTSAFTSSSLRRLWLLILVLMVLFHMKLEGV